MEREIQLREDVLNELRRDPAIDATRMSVAVKYGVVTLTGYVASYRERHAAKEATRRIYGVKAIADELDIKLAVPMRTEI